MSLKRYAAKRDQNEGSIIKALQRCGASVIRLSERGAPDLLVLFRGDLFVLEIKSRIGVTTVAQAQTCAAGWPVYLVRSVYDALRAVGVAESVIDLIGTEG